MLDQLRAATADGGLAIPTDQSGLTSDGRPYPSSGKWFYGVWHGPRTNRSMMYDESSFSLMVTVTAKVDVPFDRIGPNLLELTDGLEDRAEAVWTNFFAHQWTGQYTATAGLMQRAAAYLLSAGSTYGFVEAPYPSQMTAPIPVRADWFSATDNAPNKSSPGVRWDSANMPFSGFKIDITFSGALRMMNNADAIA